MAAPQEVNISNLTGKWVMNRTLSDDPDPVLALQGVSWWTRQALKLATVTLHVKQYTGPATYNTLTSVPPPDAGVATPPPTSISPVESPTETTDPLQMSTDAERSVDNNYHTEVETTEPTFTHVDIAQTATGGISGTTENRTLDWMERDRNDSVFGKGRGKSRWVALADVEDEYLKEGWKGEEEGDSGESERGGPNGEKYVESYVDADRGWTAQQVWGFARVYERGAMGNRYYVRRVMVVKGDKTLRIKLVYNYLGRTP